jgi:predicted RNase H-like HicB family nuclease
MAETTISSPNKDVTLTVAFHPSEEGGFWAECLDIPGCVSQGETEAEVHASIKEAIDACLGVMFEDRLRQVMQTRDLSDVNLLGISKQERITVRTPHFVEEAVA